MTAVEKINTDFAFLLPLSLLSILILRQRKQHCSVNFLKSMIPNKQYSAKKPDITVYQLFQTFILVVVLSRITGLNV